MYISKKLLLLLIIGAITLTDCIYNIVIYHRLSPLDYHFLIVTIISVLITIQKGE